MWQATRNTQGRSQEFVSEGDKRVGSVTGGVQWGLGQSLQKPENYAENLIECQKVHTVQRKNFQRGNFGGEHVHLPKPQKRIQLGRLKKNCKIALWSRLKSNHRINEMFEIKQPWTSSSATLCGHCGLTIYRRNIEDGAILGISDTLLNFPEFARKLASDFLLLFQPSFRPAITYVHQICHRKMAGNRLMRNL